jgi:membrane fusion protein (multidrug efflux system)
MRPTVQIVAFLLLVGLSGGAYWHFVVQQGTVDGLVAQVSGARGAGGSAGGAPAGGGPAGGGPAGGGMPPMPVEVAPVRTGALARTVTAVGSLISNESVVVRPEVAGRIVEILFAEGQRAARGSVLFRLDDSVARATVAQRQAELAFSRAELLRANELQQKGAGSVRSREQALSAQQVADAGLQLARAQLDKLVLTAPFDGVVGLRKVSVGDVVQAGKDLVNIEAIDTLKLDFRVPELYLPAVRTGQTLALALDAWPGRSFEGQVYAIDPLVDVNGRAIVIRARVPNPDGLLRPGVFARVQLTLTVNPQAVLIPEQALVPVGNKQFVFKVVDGKAVQTAVVTGVRRGGEVEMVEGLKPGDVVVTGGQIKIRDGASVAPVPATPPAAPPADPAKPARS